ncbi:hypothetical protein [Merdimonas faecis]|uniref:hypothetical protein n=1 Tax=Merdimonas faecis TaxID=1653435 RepID=UPI0022E80A01|nr:hypothetical protein [Merdimonas faecis]
MKLEEKLKSAKVPMSVLRIIYKEEIDLIDPPITICCGTKWLLKEKVYSEEEWEIIERKCKIYDLPYPARRGINIKEYGRKEIKNEYNAENEKQQLETRGSDLKKQVASIVDRLKKNWSRVRILKNRTVYDKFPKP